VQPYDNTSASKQKYKNTELYLLPPSLFTVHPLDTIDQRYLDTCVAPIVNPLKRSMKIELYNEKWLREKGKNISTSSAITNKPSSVLDYMVFCPNPDISYPSTQEMHQDSGTAPDKVESASPIFPESVGSDATPASGNLHDDISSTTDKLFFIAYTPSGTMTKRWYLV